MVCCRLDITTIRKKTQNWKNKYEQRKKIYVTFIPLLTYDWHGMSESYGPLDHDIGCGRCDCVCTLPLSQHSSSVFFADWRVCTLHTVHGEWAVQLFANACCVCLGLPIATHTIRFVSLLRLMCVDCATVAFGRCKWSLSYAGVLLQGSACFYHAFRYDRIFVYGMRPFD